MRCRRMGNWYLLSSGEGDRSRGWTEDLVRNTVDNPYTIRASVNKATGNSATVFYTQQGSYVIVDDVTKAIVQISDNINPST